MLQHQGMEHKHLCNIFNKKVYQHQGQQIGFLFTKEPPKKDPLCGFVCTVVRIQASTKDENHCVAFIAVCMEENSFCYINGRKQT